MKTEYERGLRDGREEAARWLDDEAKHSAYAAELQAAIRQSAKETK